MRRSIRYISRQRVIEVADFAPTTTVLDHLRLARGLTDVANHADTDVLKKKYRGNIIDVSPVEYISLTINGGYRGMEERKKYYALAQQVLVR